MAGLLSHPLTPEASRAVAEMYSEAVRADDESELYGCIARCLPDLVPAARASVTLVIPGTAMLEVLGLRGEQGPYPVGRRLPIATSGPGRAITTGTTQSWRASDPNSFVETDAMRRLGLDGMIAVPLLVQDEIVGSLNAARAGCDFDDEHVRVMTEFGWLISTNLDRLQALARTRAKLAAVRADQRRIESLGELGRRLSACVTDGEAFDTVMSVAAELLQIDRLSLAIPTEDALHYRVAAVSTTDDRLSGPDVGEVRPLAGTGVGAVLETNQASYCPNLSSAKYADRTPPHRMLRSTLSVPVHAHGEVVAVMNSGATDVEAYSESDRVTFTAIATVLGETLERIRARDELAWKERQLAALVDESPLLMLTIDENGTILQVSRFGATQLGHDPKTLRDRRLVELYPEDERPAVIDQLDILARAAPGTVTSWEARMYGAASGELWVRHTARKLSTGTGRPVTMLVCENVTELLELTEQLEHQATHDALTGLVNRREFDRLLTELIDQGDGEPVGNVCFIDLDQFKIVNDTAGHQAGDVLLAAVAQRLRALVQSHDIVARLGGDEFGVLLPGCSMASAVRVAERLRSEIRNLPFAWEGRTYGVSLSIGVASIGAKGDSIVKVMRRADAACYDAKHRGRDRVSVAGSQHRGTTVADSEWARRIREAMANDGLQLAFQSIAPVGGPDSRRRLEALVRLRDTDGSLVSAGQFVPAAERSGLVTEIDTWVLGEVVALLSSPTRDVADIDYVAVNLSARSIESDDFLEVVLDTVSRADMDTSKLLFEITETAALSQFARPVRFIETLAAVGCRFALDDFGAGFSTYAYLKRLPVDVLKIDGALIRDLTTDPLNRTIVQSITGVAKTLGMSTVAEFVENGATLARLGEIGVDFAQGYHIGRPEPSEDVWHDA